MATDFAITAPTTTNVGLRLTQMAATMPHETAVIVPGRRRAGRRVYARHSFADLEEDSNRIASGIVGLGAERGARLALMVRPSFDFISLVFAMLKSGATAVLIDPGMGVKSVLRCLDEVQPDGFVAIPRVQAIRSLLGARYRRARFNITVGRRGWWGGPTLDSVRRQPIAHPWPATMPDDPAAIIFTSGSTGPPKGVLYSHANFAAQVDAIRERYEIEPGGIDLACFPLFGLFNCVMGVTTVIPNMNASRPAAVDPVNIIEAVHDCGVTQSFASPAVWKRVTAHCAREAITLPTLRRVFSAGAPVSPEILERLERQIHPLGEAHTPYGATEALPVASIASSEVLSETRAASRRGAGICVGSRFANVEWKIIRIVDGPIATIDDIVELNGGEIGELIVRAPQVTRSYVTSPQATALAKIYDGQHLWHRMGDVGYLDARDRFWYCGRMSQRVATAAGTLFTEVVEGVFNPHPAVSRTAFVGIGPRGEQMPVLVVEPNPKCWPRSTAARRRLGGELRQLGQSHPEARAVTTLLIKRSFPVDVRHNSKINRELLADWAASRIRNGI